MTRAVRTPARITGTARGSSILRRTPRLLIPIPLAASMVGSSTWSRPTIVFRKTGMMAKTVRAMIAVKVPRPMIVKKMIISP